jgi:hypothetical protein
MSAPEPVPATEPAVPQRRCQNCGELLLGEHCYACGQPTKGLVRHFSSIIGDFMDSVFELDSRILRTLGPLLFKPGHLSEEYFAGRRVRYVSPVRLFVFLSLFAFFAAQLSFDIDVDPPKPDKAESAAGKTAGDDAERSGDKAPGAGAGTGAGRSDDKKEGRANGNLRQATTVAEVERIRDEALAEIRKARAEAVDVPGVGIGLDVAEKGIAAEAARRINEIRESERTGEPLRIPEDTDGRISFDGTAWDAETNPLTISWFSDGMNKKLNERIGRAEGNIERIQKDPNLLKDAFLSSVPTTLFVLLPLFALFLKIAYLFKRRLYMEHLIVALHSHSFLCASLLVVLLLDALATWTAGMAWLSRPLGWIEVALIVWMPVYLLLMQKRVYRQGWIMTTLKYCVLGSCYLVLISIGATFGLLASLVSI